MDKNKWTTASIPDQKGNIIIITGANSGLGFAATKILSQQNATVIMAVRNMDKGEQALMEVKKITPNANLSLMKLDLSDLDSINAFAKAFSGKYDTLNILINNAGLMYPPKREETKQGFEIQIGTNHLGHFALTGLLFDLIKKTPKSRVVTQSSLAHINADIRLDDLNWEKTYSKRQAYGQSKLANLLFTYELDRKFKEHNINSIATAAHPGISKTNLMLTSSNIFQMFTHLVAQKPETGALSIIRAATDEQLTGGEYIGPSRLGGMRGFPELIKSSNKSYDVKLAKELWVVSEKMTGVHFK